MSPLRAIVATYRDSFSGLSRPVWLLSLAVLINRSGTMVVPFLVLWLTEQQGWSPSTAGLGLSVMGLGSVVGALAGGALADRVGALSVQIASLLATGALFLVLEGLDTLPAVFGVIFLLAAAGEAFRPANAVALSDLSGDAERTRAFALRRQGINLGMTLGPAVGGLLARIDYAWLFRLDAATCFAAAIFLGWVFRQGLPAGSRQDSGEDEGRSPWRDRRFLAFVGLMAGISILFFQLIGGFPLTLRHFFGFTEELIGFAFAFNTLLILMFEMPLVRALERHDPLRIVAAGALFVGLGFGLLPFGAGYAWVLFTVAVWTLGEMFFAPFGESWAAGRAGADSRGAYMGAFTLAYSAGFILGPGLGSWVYETQGPYVLWTATAIGGVLLAAALLALAARPEGSHAP